MVLGSRNRERFWITLTVRFAFGFLFLIAAINILFCQYDESQTPMQNIGNIQKNMTAFVDLQSKSYETSWLNIKVNTGPIDEATGASKEQLQLGMLGIRYFLYAMPVIFLLLAIPLITGIFSRVALRLSAIFLVMLGLGKYVVDFKTGITMTTLQDFIFAMMICMALFIGSKEEVAEREALPEEAAVR